MLKRFILFSILFFNTTLSGISLTSTEEAEFLKLMDSQLGQILNDTEEFSETYATVHPLQDGGPSFINSVYLIKTTTGKELIIKISNPIWKGFKTLNEVSALSYLKQNTNLPVPAVVTYNNDADQSLLGVEYIIMPRIKGSPLSSEIGRIYQDKITYHKVLDQLARAIAELKTHQFDHIGNFIMDMSSQSLQIHGIVDFAGYDIDEACKHYSEYAKHALKYYIHEMEILMQKGAKDSELYARMIPILNDLLALPAFLTLDTETDLFQFSHQDFVMKNILVDKDQITAILDWEWSGSALMEIEAMTGFDFLFSEDDRLYFSRSLESYGIHDFFAAPPKPRQLFYRLIGNVYTLVALREWQEGKLEHTAKFLSQKLEQRKIRNNKDFDCEAFLKEVESDLMECIQEFKEVKAID